MKKSSKLQLALGACPSCGGDLYIAYKNGSRWKCLKCKRYYVPDKDVKCG